MFQYLKSNMELAAFSFFRGEKSSPSPEGLFFLIPQLLFIFSRGRGSATLYRWVKNSTTKQNMSAKKSTHFKNKEVNSSGPVITGTDLPAQQFAKKDV